MAEAYLVEVEAEHKCWCIELSEKFHSTSLIGIPTHAERANSIAHLFVINTENVGQTIEFIQKHPMTTIVRIIKKSKESVIVFVEQPRNSLFVDAATSRGAVLANPTLTRDGKDTLNLFFRDEKDIRRMFSELREEFDVKLKSKQIIDPQNVSIETLQTSNFFKLQSAASLLSQRQREVFSLACKRGYFKTPKQVSIEELAKELGLDSRTTADHLRKAKNKLLPAVFDIINRF